MPLSTEIKDAVYQYCNNHLADEAWYNGEFEFIEDQALRKRLIEEFKGIRFAYKLYEGEDTQIRFDDKCKAAEKLGLLHSFISNDGSTIDLTSEIIEIYGYRNAIHLVAEQRKGIEYELELSKRAYRRMRPFIDQIKEKLKMDRKGIYAD